MRSGLWLEEIPIGFFGFFNDNRRVILLHGLQKKTRKTPRNEFERAKKLRKDYYENK